MFSSSVSRREQGFPKSPAGGEGMRRREHTQVDASAQPRADVENLRLVSLGSEGRCDGRCWALSAEGRAQARVRGLLKDRMSPQGRAARLA